jgi:LacI family transcriptional regulator
VTQRVHDAAQSLDYRTNYSAKATSTGSSAFVAIVVSDIRDPLSAEIAHSVTAVATAHDLVPMIAGTGPRGGAGVQVLRQLRSVQPEAIIIIEPPILDYDTSPMAEELSRYVKEGGRVAIVGDSMELGAQVTLSWQAGATDLMSGLANRGYSHPTIITADGSSTAMRRWRRGMETGAAQDGLDIDTWVVPCSQMDRDGGYSATKQIMKSRQSTDVVICASDIMAIGAMAAIRDAGLTLGPDVAVAGYGNLVMADKVLHPYLTSVDLDLARAGDQALTSCLDPDPAADPIVLDHRIELRESTPTRR